MNLNFSQVKSIRKLKYAYAGFCMSCGQGSVDMVSYPKPIIRWEVTLFNDKKLLLCEACREEVQRFLKEANK